VVGKQGRTRRQLLDDLKETRGCCKLKEIALGRTVRRIRSGRGSGPVLRQIECKVNQRIHAVQHTFPKSENLKIINLYLFLWLYLIAIFYLSS
jgi:hypothetical protein